MLGFLFIDKPEGLSSFDCIRKLRKALNMRRIGFIGTLDPLATGLLIFALGEGTKMIPYLEGLDKTYDVTIRFGAISTTYDREGEIEELPGTPEPSRSHIEHLLEDDFLGEQNQIPPVFSAVHIDGRRAYEMARKKEKVEMKPRKVAFYDLHLKSYKWPQARIIVHCSSGTYVRSFAHDLGQKLGCGGYVEALRRTKVGSYSVKKAAKIEEVHAANVVSFLLKPEEMFHDWLQVQLNQERYDLLRHGGFVENFARLQKGPALAMYGGQCIGILEVHSSGRLKLARRFNGETM